MRVDSSVCRLMMSRARISSATVSPYPDLISKVVVPWRRACSSRWTRLPSSSSSVAARVAAIESRDDGFAARVDGLELGQLPYRGDLTVDDVIVVDRRDLGARGRRRAAAETARSLFAGTEMLRDCGVRLGGRSRPDDTAV